MPLDPLFTSAYKPKRKLNRYGKPRPEPKPPKQQKARPQPESAEMQLGRSDHRLGAQQENCPFPLNGNDAYEWIRGWLAERVIEINHREANEQRYRKHFRCPA